MQINRFSSEENIYGYLDNDNIYIREDMKGIDYIETLLHELVHWIIWKTLPNQFHRFFNCWFDMLDGFINTFSLKLVKEYYRSYYEI